MSGNTVLNGNLNIPAKGVSNDYLHSPVRRRCKTLLSPRIFIFWVLILKLSLDITYYNFVLPIYGYVGFEGVLLLERLLISYLLVGISALIVARVARSPMPSSIGLLVIYFMYLLPILSLWSLSGASTLACFLFVAGFLCTVLMLIIPSPSLAPPNISESVPIIGLSTLVGVTVVVLLLRGGVSHFNLSFSDVYEVRRIVYHEVVTGSIAYLVGWTGKCANVLLMSWAMLSRRVVLFSILASIQVLLFGLVSNKEYLFYPLIPLLFYLASLRSYKVAHAIVVAIIVASVVSYGIFVTTGKIEFGAVVLMRALFAQALNSYEYFDFFQIHDYVLWSNSILEYFIEYPYDVPIPSIIGLGRYGEESAAFANTGYLGSGYMQFGPFGIILYSVLAGLMLKGFDIIGGNEMPLALSGGVTFVAATQLVNIDAMIVFFSSGVFIAYGTLYLLRSRYEGRRALPSPAGI